MISGEAIGEERGMIIGKEEEIVIGEEKRNKELIFKMYQKCKTAFEITELLAEPSPSKMP